MIQSTYLKSVRQAIDRFDLIQKGDRILVGVSGGKDSTLLFIALNTLSKMKPYDFSVTGLIVNHGMLSGIEEYTEFCKSRGYDLVVHDENYAVNLDQDNSKTPCYTCARLRKGILKRYAQEKGFNGVAYGHTKDDLIETFLMNIKEHGKLASIPPKIVDNETQLKMIRPLLYVDEMIISKAVHHYGVPLMHDTCTFAKHRLRSQMEELMQIMDAHSPGMSDQIVKALHHVDLNRLMT